ncbi:phosphate ABC transporter substrate-binding protein PstS [Polynucleobacter necessarius]|uniref:phosphate ABC transporter substrate-binding protein PstS n=1 Tax=Polynucleobacter necessarius TaxID=576610 RepID=UPI000E09BEC1|nr:phosphate ABC transporter substrate-binding protein PstS [Polynucleobacter necessarius]
MKLLIKIAAIVCALMTVGVHAQTEISGAGSSLAYPVIKELTKLYKAQTKVAINYTSVGSGEGIVQMAARVVDFSLSDIPLTQYELNDQNLVQFPVFASAIVPVLNLPGVEKGKLQLNGSVLADIYLGRITQWDDPAIQALNSDLQLPKLPIKVVYRSDISGSSYVFTSYLSRSSVHWNTHYGIGSKLNWPIGQGVKGSAGVEQFVLNNEGAIGYLEYGAASSAALDIPGLLLNGKKVVANYANFIGAFNAMSPVRSSFYQFTAPISIQNAWPIIAITYALVSKRPTDDEEVRGSLQFFYWLYQSGGTTIQSFNLLPIDNKKMLPKIEAQWASISNPKGKPVWVEGAKN